MKSIETLVQDIYDLLEGKSPLDKEGNILLPEGLTERFGERMLRLITNRVVDTTERTPRLSMSNIGKPCERQVWLSINKAELAEPLKPEVRMKFLYGDMIEELLLFLAEAAGHTVTGIQDRVDLEGIYGNRDCIIDGVLVDVKSASTYSFNKFKNGQLATDDPFGYIGQIQTYLEGSQNDPLLLDKNRCAFLVMDKTLGHICLDIHNKVPFDVKEITRNKVRMVESAEVPNRAFEPEPDGKSGNMKLPMQCGYCNMKFACHPDIRVFLYSNGPRYLTKVEKLPDVYEVVDEKRMII